MTARTWATLDNQLNQYEYGYEECREAGGIPPNCYIVYGPSEPLIEIVPILKGLSAVMVSRFGLLDRSGDDIPFPEITDLTKRYDAIAATLVRDGALHCTIDDVIVYGELKGDTPEYSGFLMLWMDRSGKCSCARVMSSDHEGLTLDEFKALHLQELKDSYRGGWKHNIDTQEPIIVDIPGEFNRLVYP